MEYYVSAKARRGGDGSKEQPFQKINTAAAIAKAGDVVYVLPGIYREWVNPLQGGTDEEHRIEYRSTEPLKAVITGSELLSGWSKVSGNVWSAVVPNEVFGNYNPYTTEIFGDWYYSLTPRHTGEVFLNGRSMYEVFSMEDLEKAEISDASWEGEFSRYQWMVEQKDGATVFYANFQEKDPNAECVEISVRKNCFRPEKTGINYITVSGFTITQAATDWAPPTAYQDGMIGPHWAKGWIIENCDISNSKCSGVSLGKYLQTENDNKWSVKYLKDGTQTERECIFQAFNEGWTKENIGSHIVRKCHIHDCGQTGIVGHLGGVFSLIEDNEIDHINSKQELMGAEIGGIKMHAAIDCIFRRNHIHHCTRGIWLDWQVQGTRVTQNLFHDNVAPEGLKLTSDISLAEDLFIEVSHGPSLVDNNIMLSPCAMRISAQGIAVVNNLMTGSITWVGEGTENSGKDCPTPRYTPYHVPHKTDIAGIMTFMHGDIRFYNNLFIQGEKREDLIAVTDKIGNHKLSEYNFICGTKPYDGYPTPEEYFAMFTEDNCREKFCLDGIRRYKDLYYGKMPVYTGGNAYFNGAEHCDIEQDYMEDTEHKVYVNLCEKDGLYYLDTNVYDYLEDCKVGVMSTEKLGMAFEPEERFENLDGSDIIFNEDYFGNHRNLTAVPGPFAEKPEQALI